MRAYLVEQCLAMSSFSLQLTSSVIPACLYIIMWCTGVCFVIFIPYQ